MSTSNTDLILSYCEEDEGLLIRKAMQPRQQYSKDEEGENAIFLCLKEVTNL